MAYKQELDRQLVIKNTLKGYGTMTAEEKHFNKMELDAYKDYGGVNHSMVPGI